MTKKTGVLSELLKERCARIDICPKVKSMRSRDWADDRQFAGAIREMCSTCEDFVSISQQVTCLNPKCGWQVSLEDCTSKWIREGSHPENIIGVSYCPKCDTEIVRT